MANEAPKPPTNLFQGLSLGDSPPQNNSPQRKIAPLKRSRYTNPTAETTSSGNIFPVGTGSQTPAGSTGQFESITFFAPGPVLPRTKPGPQATQLQAPIAFFTTPPTQTPRPKVENPAAAPLSSLRSPSTPKSTPRSPSIFSSTPNSDFAATPTPEPPALAPPYDAAAEAAPPHPLFSATFQDALKQGPEIAQGAARAIQTLRASVGDNKLVKLLAEAMALRRFRGTDSRTIAVLGDSGEGKKPR